ncbi:alpha/beta hydrolase-fold protein [Alteromonas sp. KUL49]|uniref:alpha/beta hydrolase n=1 Tax=Alteromonas sp. KUL49 TaxID=2480798 RepID=UPI00102F267E|nr:alpha/beta hydrolase-fold protein [Alteromonas sp. KUL49]TAP33815.1 ATPase [Alteromonas sp. KUL49]GEA13678.1 tributyrin esterase [Alteromonas sp. KUL49]
MSVLRVEKSNSQFTQENVTRLTLHSSHTARRHDITVYAKGELSPNTPMIVLLHGVYGSHWVWMELGGAHYVYERLKKQGLQDFVLVMPSDGGLWDGSGYLPLRYLGNYEQWIMDDVIQGVTSLIPCLTEQSPVYLSGLSMGGYGTLRLGAKYPERFAGLSAHSSVTSLEDLQQFIELPIDEYHSEDSREPDLLHWFNKNKENIPPLRFDCGVDDTLHQSNVALHNALTSLGIPHSVEFFPGGHEWAYWHEHLEQTLWFFNDIQKQKAIEQVRQS